jgi:hypothetical protein
MNQRISTADAVVNASRQVWLAGLGAAVVTREWANKEAATVFRTLVREGTAVESRAMRIVGDRLESSIVQANALWKLARRGVTTTVRAAADTAATLVRDTLPVSLPGVGAKPVRVPRKSARKATPAKRPAKRATRKTAKRA